MHRLVYVYTCQNATLLEITCRGSYVLIRRAKYRSTGPQRLTLYLVETPLNAFANRADIDQAALLCFLREIGYILSYTS